MKANDYIKNYGWICAGIEIAEIEHSKDFDGFYRDLKRLVESHELVESYGGLDLARKEAHKDCFGFNAPLLKSIADVESCHVD